MAKLDLTASQLVIRPKHSIMDDFLEHKAISNHRDRSMMRLSLCQIVRSEHGQDPWSTIPVMVPRLHPHLTVDFANLVIQCNLAHRNFLAFELT